MKFLKMAGAAIVVTLSMFTVAHATTIQSITSAGSDQYGYYNAGVLELGSVALDYGSQITALTTSVTLVDQGWGSQDPSNGVFVQLVSNEQAIYSFFVAGANHSWQTVVFDLASNADLYSGLNAALAGISPGAGPIELQLLTNAWNYSGWALHTANVSLTVTSSIAAVPEPATYAMVLLGLGIILLVQRRKPAASTLA